MTKLRTLILLFWPVTGVAVIAVAVFGFALMNLGGH